MKTFYVIVLTLGLLTVGSAQPTITQISNAASSSLSPLPSSGIALGSFFAIYGTGLGPTKSAIWAPYPLPTMLPATNGSTVSVTVGGTTKPAYLFFTIASQINAVMPSSLPTGAGTVTVTFNGQTSAPMPITVAPASFGTFAVNQGGSGPGIFFNIDPTTHIGSQNSPFNTAKPGQVITTYGTGLGAPADVANEGSAAPTFPDDFTKAPHNLQVKIWVGGKAATVSYAGRSQFTAEDQINFTVPTDVQPGCYVNVAIEVGPTGSSITSNFTSLSVDADGAPCKDADGINMSDIQTAVQNNGKANVAAISLLSNYVPINILGQTIQFDNDSVNGEIGTFSKSVLDGFQGFTISPTVGNCTASQFLQYPPPSDPELSLVTYLNAGAALSISGGQGPNATQSVPANSNGKGYSNLVGGAYISCPPDKPSCPSLFQGTGEAPYFLTASESGSTFTPTGIAAATYTVSAPGASGGVGSFSGTIAVSSAAASFKWTNSSIASNPIPRNTPLNITWSGGDPNGFVDITLIGSTETGIAPLKTDPGILVECIVPAGPGSFSVPTYVLQSMPSTIGGGPVAGELLVGPASGGVPITPTPSGLDAAYLFFHIIGGASVSWQ